MTGLEMKRATKVRNRRRGKRCCCKGSEVFDGQEYYMKKII